MVELLEFSIMISGFSLPFATFSLSPQAMKAWHKLFKHESILDLEFAFTLVTKEPGRLYFPTPGEITQAIERMHAGRKATAGAAWEEAVLFAQKGAEAKQVFKSVSPASAYALRIIGWDYLRTADTSKDLPFVKKDFERYYNEHSEESRKLEVLEKEKSRCALEFKQVFSKLLTTLDKKDGNV